MIGRVLQCPVFLQDRDEHDFCSANSKGLHDGIIDYGKRPDIPYAGDPALIACRPFSSFCFLANMTALLSTTHTEPSQFLFLYSAGLTLDCLERTANIPSILGGMSIIIPPPPPPGLTTLDRVRA